MNVKIICENGKPGKTKIINTETGELIQNVSAVKINPISCKDDYITAELIFILSDIELDAHAYVSKELKEKITAVYNTVKDMTVL